MRVIRIEDHNEWGNKVDWFDFATRQIEGHLVEIPKRGDLIISKMGSGKNGVFEIIKVDRCHDPKDQFFAVVKDLGYEDGEECVFVADQDSFDRVFRIWDAIEKEREEELMGEIVEHLKDEGLKDIDPCFLNK